MNDKPKYFLLGCFVLMGVGLLIVGILIFGGGQMFAKKTFCETYVDGSVQGIDVGTAVKFRGVTIGRVQSIDFTFNLYDLQNQNQVQNYVAIVMEIDRPVSPGFFDANMGGALEKNIREGLRARIQPQGITGLNFLDFGYVDPLRYPPIKVAWKPYHFYIPYAPGEITSFLDSINNIMKEIEDLKLGEFTKSGQELLTNLNKAVVDARIGEVSTDLREVVAALQSSIDGAKVAEVSSDLRTLIDQLQRAIADAKVADVSSDLRNLLSGLQSSNDRLEQILKNLVPASDINPEQLQEVVANASAISENLLQMSQAIKRRPSLLLWGTNRGAVQKSSPTPAPSRRAKARQ